MYALTRPLETTRLVLRQFRAQDLDDLAAIQSRADVVRYLYWDVRGREEVQTVIERRIEQTSLSGDGDTLVLAVQRRDNQRVIGDVSLVLASAAHRQGEIGFVFDPAHSGMGYATEAVVRVLQLAFHDIGLHRVFGRTDARNTASAKLMDRIGMRLEAHFVQNEIFKGDWEDELVFAILASEWNERTGQTGGEDGRRR